MGFQRNTPQRRVILEELRKSSGHPTAVELYETVRRRMPKISLGTVYRNLDRLAEMGTIQKLDPGGSEARFDGDMHAHYHVRCIRCGRVDDVHAPEPTLAGGRLKHATGYEILGYRLEFIGVCPGCRSDRAVENKERPHEAGGSSLANDSRKECPAC